MPRNIIEAATELLPLDRMLFELRIPPDNTDPSESSSIESIIVDAVGAVAADTEIPIMPETASVVLYPSSIGIARNYIIYESDPFALNFIKTRHPVNYATTREQSLAGVYSGQLQVTPTNEPIDDNATSGLLSASIEGSLPANARFIQLTYKRGLFADSHKISELRTMSILKARSIFDGTISVPDKSRSAYERLLEKVRFEGILPMSFNRIAD